ADEFTSLAGSLAAVSASSATDAWAVGETRARTTLALHWKGTSWAQVPTPAPGAVGSFLSGVTDISPPTPWAVGSSNTSSGSATLVLHWNGTGWTRAPSPSPGTSADTTACPRRRGFAPTGRLCGPTPEFADLARRQLVVVERHGQAQIIRFCANVTARVNPD